MTQPSVLITHHLSSSELIPELLKDILSKGAECRFKAKGHSMSPFIKDGDVVTVSPLLPASPGIGDVVAFIHKETGRLLIHRIVGRNGESYLIRGDNTLEGDGLIHKANILGFVTKVERNEKEVLLGLGPEKFFIAFLTQRGLFTSLLLPVWIMIRRIFSIPPFGFLKTLLIGK
jgi:signal peptidase